ncbi:MAG: DUF4965 domain-containing protein [Ruminococcaceae bacterium]|nr:DUF4965 domain-containing protein [Oscillospiraceae bacterium]
MKRFRPAAAPLVTVDPFFSIWSCDDALYGGPTEHWSGRPCPILAGIYVDNGFYSMSAFDDNGKIVKARVYQTGMEITPLSTIYTFENELAKVKLTFTTPLLLDRLDILTRPVSYVKYEITPKTQRKIRFVFGISSRACVDNKTQCVGFKKAKYSLACGNVCQTPLSQSGDLVLIDWGYLHMVGGVNDVKVGRVANQRGLELLPTNNVYNAYSEEPYLIAIKNELEGVITVGYDEIKPIEYFGDQLDEYYTKYFDSFDDMLYAASREYDEIKKLCDEFDTRLMEETGKLSEDYKNITALAYRQAVAAHKLVEDKDGNILFLSKENDSNGCIGTLDVTYPSIPLFLKYAPELVKGMLRPIIKFAKSDAWPYDFTPHDVGRYPLANGQVYSTALFTPTGDPVHRIYGEYVAERQMPVEEAGNMLLCLAAVKKYFGGDQTLFDADKELMKKWADYLIKFGYDPENQLCTDDFAGHLARNCNLSLKAILGIAAYSELSGDASYMDIAREYAKNWEKDAKASHDGTRLTFDNENGWSLKYNIVWDTLLGYNLFSDEVKKNEINVYKSKMNRYGVPLDSRSDYTKIDWLMWSTVIYDDKEYFDGVCESIVNMINETVDRVPMTDYYYTSTAAHRAFRCRSVVGGLFINLL